MEGVSSKSEPSMHVDNVESEHDHGKEDPPNLHVPATTASPASSTEEAQAPNVSSGHSKKRPTLTRSRRGE